MAHYAFPTKTDGMQKQSPSPLDKDGSAHLERPTLVDTTVAAHVANEIHGERYGEDWVWHDDRLGVIPPEQALEMMSSTPS